MYVCVCQAVTNRQISATIAQGATTFKALRDELGVATCCGKCSKDVRAQLRQECSGHKSCACAGQG
ncbi:MAG: (2Fe-2S)-binding protein [Betaproteobacteria bacterium]|uniref:Bacterioferritin-associated ferredoxin n=1 Tax=Candidatus Proximibacter danicus TaxID=2954365 RepID=A0A9D7PR92_9PROT|nr:(2Fe-2S)-binding protein [Candidatus Proximibacter danicus]MBK9447631.1 (2Fe-2S)-binding protein [Betaproteobacteria bacterium]